MTTLVDRSHADLPMFTADLVDLLVSHVHSAVIVPGWGCTRHDGGDMDVPEGLKGTYDAVTVRRVYGDPIERDGIMLIPAAAVRGGLGYGGGHDDKGNEGGGGGSGLSARPVGMYRIQDGKVGWQPAFDLTRIVIGGQIVAIVALLVARSILKRRRRRR